MQDLRITEKTYNGNENNENNQTKNSEPNGGIATKDNQPSDGQVLEAIQETVKVLAPDQVVEMRALDVAAGNNGQGRTVSGFYEPGACHLLAEDAVEVMGAAKGVYITLNPIRTDIIESGWNECGFARNGAGTKDEDILCRRWLLVDADPQRPSAVSANDAEKEKAKETIQKVKEFLLGLGWPEPVVCDSGNGYHLLYRIDLPAEDNDLVKRVLEALGDQFSNDDVKIDKAVFNPSRITKLYGSKTRKGPDTSDRPHRWSAILEVPSEIKAVPQALLEAIAAKAKTPSAGQLQTSAKNRVRIPASESVLKRARAYIVAMGPAISGQGGHNHTFKVACTLILGFDLSIDEALPLFREWNATLGEKWTEWELRHKLEDADKKDDERGYHLGPDERQAATSGTPLSGDYPAIVVNGKQLRTLVKETWETILANNDPPKIFQKDGRAYRLVEVNKQPQLQMMEEVDVLDLLTQNADWFKKNGEGEQQHSIPPGNLLQLIAFKPSRALPPIQGVVYSPVFGKNGHLIEGEGYHSEDEVWYHPDAELQLSPVSDKPTNIEIEAAKATLLDDLFVDFPFVDDAAKAHTVAAMLLPFVRRMIDGPTPLHLVEAPTAGSGKSLLCKLIGLVSTGAVIEACTLPKSQDEMKKMITSSLINGRPVILLDNAVDKVDSGSLASVITAPYWTDRILGHSQMVSVHNLAVWMLTANNPQLSMEIARRCIRIRLDTMDDQPWRREGFKHKFIEEWARENRGKIVHAVLTLIQAWIAAGKPSSTGNLGSFEAWLRVIGGILQVAGIKGFLGNLQSLYDDADVEGAMWREFVAAWWSTFKNKTVSVSDLLALCKGDLMADVRGSGNEQSQRIKIGAALKKAKDRVFAGLRINRINDTKANCWNYYLEELERHPKDGLEGNQGEIGETRGTNSGSLSGSSGSVWDPLPDKNPSVLRGESDLSGSSGSFRRAPKTFFSGDRNPSDGVSSGSQENSFPATGIKSQKSQTHAANPANNQEYCLGPTPRQSQKSQTKTQTKPSKAQKPKPSSSGFCGKVPRNYIDW